MIENETYEEYRVVAYMAVIAARTPKEFGDLSDRAVAEIAVERFMECMQKYGRRGAVRAFEKTPKKAAAPSHSAHKPHTALRHAAAVAYQLAGQHGESVKVLDNFSALAQGEPLPHSWDDALAAAKEPSE